MSDQLELDGFGGRLDAEAGMAQASAADRVQVWKALADGWYRAQPKGALITADDLTRSIGLPGQGINQNNVVGAWFSARQRAGELEHAGTTTSLRRIRHRNLFRVWRIT